MRMKRLCVGIVGMAFGLVGIAGAQNSLEWADAGSSVKKESQPVSVEAKFPRAGGENCAAATVIGSIPYDDSGTTVGAVDDYDVACSWTSTSPDVVYVYTPTSDETVDISVCTNGGDADYDTKLFVFEGIANCGGTSFACNDDACQAPSYTSAYNSEITGLSLTGGTSYYIVVDGYGGGSGNYTLHVEAGTPIPTCEDISDPGFLLGQNVHGPSEGWNAVASTQATWAAPYLAAETVAQAEDPDWFDVTSINVWGLSMFNDGSWHNCDPTGMTFDVIYYEDNSGVPGTEICNVQSVAATITDTGLAYSASGYTLYRFDLAAACDFGSVGSKWVTVQSEPMTGDCGFMWMSSGTGDSSSVQDSTGDGTFDTTNAYDLSMCINGSTVPVGLQSFVVK